MLGLNGALNGIAKDSLRLIKINIGYHFQFAKYTLIDEALI